MGVEINFVCFESGSGMKVNFNKSCVVDMNVSNDFLVVGSNVLHCKIVGFPVKYFSVEIGVNPRKKGD